MENRMLDMRCNQCGKILRTERGIVQEDYIHVRKTWGYFSGKDGQIQEFVLCEDCVDSMEKNFFVPSHFEEVTEWLS